MLGEILLGSKARAENMALGIDECGNAAFGGSPQETISSRVGKAFNENKEWARLVAPIIDAIFGKNHCQIAITYQGALEEESEDDIYED